MTTDVKVKSLEQATEERQPAGLDSPPAAGRSVAAVTHSLAVAEEKSAPTEAAQPVVERATPALIASVVCAVIFTVTLANQILIPTLRMLVSTLPGSWDPGP